MPQPMDHASSPPRQVLLDAKPLASGTMVMTGLFESSPSLPPRVDQAVSTAWVPFSWTSISGETPARTTAMLTHQLLLELSYAFLGVPLALTVIQILTVDPGADFQEIRLFGVERSCNWVHCLELRERRHSLCILHLTAHRQHRTRCGADDRLGDTPQQNMSNAGATVRAHHDEIDA